jgi:Tfp pilus assembly protein PilN
MRAVNLLPRDEVGQGRKVPPLPVLVGCVGAVVVAALLAVLFLSASSGVAGKRSALEALQAQADAIPAPPAPSPVIAQLPQERQTRVTALATVLGQRVVWDRLLREVSEVVPSDVWLLTLNALAPSLAPAGGAPSAQSGFAVTGCTYSQESVARFLARLQVVPDLSGMTLSNSTASAPAGSAGAAGGSVNGCAAGMVSFKLQGSVRTAGAPS